MVRKSLIIYESMTGNTEKVAFRFKKVFDRMKWDCTILKVDKNTKNIPFKFDDFDFICVGSPIIAAVPAKNITRIFTMGGGAPSGPGNGPPAEPRPPRGRVLLTESRKKGIVFVTYAGQMLGPAEAVPALDILELHMKLMERECIGKFSCPGKEWRHDSIDKLADHYKKTIEDIAALVGKYKDNPKAAEFDSLSEEDRKLFENAIDDEKHTPTLNATPKEKHQWWHYDVQHRPNERDLLKAEIFLEELLEDYYEGLD